MRIHAAAFNLGHLTHKRFGVGTPRALQDLATVQAVLATRSTAHVLRSFRRIRRHFAFPGTETRLFRPQNPLVAQRHRARTPAFSPGHHPPGTRFFHGLRAPHSMIKQPTAVLGIDLACRDWSDIGSRVGPVRSTPLHRGRARSDHMARRGSHPIRGRGRDRCIRSRTWRRSHFHRRSAGMEGSCGARRAQGRWPRVRVCDPNPGQDRDARRSLSLNLPALDPIQYRRLRRPPRSTRCRPVERPGWRPGCVPDWATGSWSASRHRPGARPA